LGAHASEGEQPIRLIGPQVGEVHQRSDMGRANLAPFHARPVKVARPRAGRVEMVDDAFKVSECAAVCTRPQCSLGEHHIRDAAEQRVDGLECRALFAQAVLERPLSKRFKCLEEGLAAEHVLSVGRRAASAVAAGACRFWRVLLCVACAQQHGVYFGDEARYEI
jgi:hypothetical protein